MGVLGLEPAGDGIWGWMDVGWWQVLAYVGGYVGLVLVGLTFRSTWARFLTMGMWWFFFDDAPLPRRRTRRVFQLVGATLVVAAVAVRWHFRP